MGTSIVSPTAPKIELSDFPPKRLPDNYVENVSTDNSVASQFRFIKEFANAFIWGSTEGYTWNMTEPGENSVFWFMEQLRSLVTSPQFPQSLSQLSVDYNYDVGELEGILSRLATYRPTALTESQLTIARVDPPEVPTMVEVEQPTDMVVPQFQGERPVITIPPDPDETMPKEPGQAPTLFYPDDVEAPTYDTPTKPEIGDITWSEKPEVNIPVWNLTAPTMPTITPAACFTWATEDGYDSELARSIRSRLQDWVDNGRTGLDPDVEAQLWERAKDRLRIEQQAAYDAIVGANRGFEFPGAMKAYALQELSNRLRSQLTDLDKEIAIAQAELAQKNTQFAMEKAISWETVILGHVDNIAARAFEAAKFAAQHAVEIYRVWAELFNARVQAYNAEVQAYNTRVQAVLTELEAWKVELQGAEIRSRIQQQKIEMYLAEWEAVKSILSVYTARIQANATKIEAERAKIQAYSAEVDAYSKRVDAKVATYNLWSSKIQGQGLLLDVYGKDLQAYATHVDALRTAAEIDKVKADIGNATNATQADVYKSRVQGYSAQVGAAIEQVKALISHYSERVRGYQFDQSAVVAQQSAELDRIKLEMENQRTDVTVDTEKYKTNMEQVWQWLKSLVDALGSEMQVAAQVGASALSALNASASIRSGFDMNWSESQSWHAAVNNGASVSASETHTFDHGEID